jgi:hypothetical protein
MKTPLIAACWILSIAGLSAAEPVVLEKLSLQSWESRGARVIGIIKNNTDHLIVQPVLEITCVTKEKPNVPLSHRLILSASLKSGESRPFHSGEFFGPTLADPDPRKEGLSQTIAEIKSARIQPGALIPPSPDWNARLEGRESFQVGMAQVTIANGEWSGLKGSLTAPAGTRIKTARFTAAYFDQKGELADVQTFTVELRDGKCIDSFPHPFTAGAGLDDPKIHRITVTCICDQVSPCE